MTKRMPYIISIEGNIGSGKTTLIHHLDGLWGCSGKDEKRYVFLREPVALWESVQESSTGENILQKFYKDQCRYAFPFQILAYMSFYKQLTDEIKKAGEDTIIICERSMQSSRAIFAKMLNENGTIEDINYQILEMFYRQIDDIPLNAIIYLDTDHTLCNERIRNRARLGESDIPMEYLERCNQYHRNWLSDIETNQNNSTSIRILRLNGILTKGEMVTNIKDFIEVVYPKYIGPCSGCNFHNIMYSDDQHWILCKQEQTRILCKKCFGDCWVDAHKDGWTWYDDVVYTGEEYETNEW
jgi:deoxyadenosine/deoxycytidine kinase